MINREIGREIGMGAFPWAEGTEARLKQNGEKFILTISVPEFRGEMIVEAGPAGVTGYDSLDPASIWKWAGGDYRVQKGIFWGLAELLINALEWAREACPQAGFPDLLPSVWRETDYGWRTTIEGGLSILLDPDGLKISI